MNKKAIVLLSGGQDSTTCLYWAKQKFEEVVALNIFYNQRHAIEIESAKKIAKMAEVKYIEFKTGIFKKIGDSALINQLDNISQNHRSSDNLPASFVPGRNIIFLTIAGMYAYKLGINNIVTGVCQTDYSGYPDCREETIKSLQNTLNLGIGDDSNLKIYTPLMHLTKKETVGMAFNLHNGCWDALRYSHTCYEGQVIPCGKCPACVLRQKGFEEAGCIDPLLQRIKND